MPQQFNYRYGLEIIIKIKKETIMPMISGIIKDKA